MKKYYTTNSSNIHQTTNIDLYNLRPIIKLFFLIVYPQYYFFIRYPTNHLNIYIKNYRNKTWNYYKYPIITHNNYKNNKSNKY